MLASIARSLQGLAVGMFGLLLAGLLVPVRGQGPENIGLQQVDADVLKKENRELILKLTRGEINGDVNNPAHKEAMEAQARFLLFRYYYEDFHNPLKLNKNIETLNKDFEASVTGLLKNPAKTSSTWPVYVRAMISQGRLVLGSRLNIARINAARCLARLAELEQPDLVDFYTEVLLDDGQIEGVKYYMIRGLGDLLAITKEPPVLKKEGVDKAARVLSAFIQRSPNHGPTTTSQEVRGYQVLRREAIRALGNARQATLSDKSHPPVLLLKILGGEGVTPPPLFDERVEAAIALARVLPDMGGDYCPDYAAAAVGSFLSQFSAFTLAENKNARLPCKVYSARLQEALEALDAKSDKQPKEVKDYVTAINKGANPVLRLLRDDVPSTNQVNKFVMELEKVVTAGPPNKSLYKSLPDAVLKGGN